jgi:GAF domain-containing protein
MSESIIINSTNKKDKYEQLIPQIAALLADETDLIAKLANLTAALKMTFDWLWIGFYLVKNQQLVLGPFQGPIACTRINYNKGVCGSAWAQQQTLIVADVEQFPGHIACSSLSKSEIVVPVFNQVGEISAVLDIDSEIYNCFDEIDRLYLEKIVKFI